MAASATIGMNVPSVPSMTGSMGLSKWKLPIVLAVAFGSVVYFQYGHLFVSEAEADTSSKAEVATAKAESVKPSATHARDESELPEIQLSEALQFDPFAPTPLLGDESPVEIVTAPPSSTPLTNAIEIEVDSALLQKLKATPIQLIYSDSHGRKVAMIGGEPVHVGDTFQGMRVLDITPGGLIVEAAESEK